MRKLKCSYATVLSSIYYFIMGCKDQQVTDKETDGQFSSSFFTARCYASALLAMGLCLSVSVTSRSSTKTAKRRITQTTPHDSPGTLVF